MHLEFLKDKSLDLLKILSKEKLFLCVREDVQVCH